MLFFATKERTEPKKRNENDDSGFFTYVYKRENIKEPYPPQKVELFFDFKKYGTFEQQIAKQVDIEIYENDLNKDNFQAPF